MRDDMKCNVSNQSKKLKLIFETLLSAQKAFFFFFKL